MGDQVTPRRVIINARKLTPFARDYLRAMGKAMIRLAESQGERHHVTIPAFITSLDHALSPEEQRVVVLERIP